MAELSFFLKYMQRQELLVYLEFLEAKRSAIDGLIANAKQSLGDPGVVEQPRLVAPDPAPARSADPPPSTTKREEPARKAPKVKAEKPAPPVKARSNARPYTQDDVLNTAVELIRANGPQPVREITEAVRGRFAKAKLSVSTALNQNAVKKKGARVEKTADGLWNIVSPAKQGKVVHGPEEAEKLLVQARANAFNQPTSDIRV